MRIFSFCKCHNRRTVWALISYLIMSSWTIIILIPGPWLPYSTRHRASSFFYEHFFIHRPFGMLSHFKSINNSFTTIKHCAPAHSLWLPHTAHSHCPFVISTARCARFIQCTNAQIKTLLCVCVRSAVSCRIRVVRHAVCDLFTLAISDTKGWQ